MYPGLKFIPFIVLLGSMHATCRPQPTALFWEGVENCKKSAGGAVTNECWENYLTVEAKTNPDAMNRCHANLSLAEFYEGTAQFQKAEAVYRRLMAVIQFPDCAKWATISYKAFSEVRIGKKAPDFQALDSRNMTIDTKALRGQMVVLLFWSSGCGACKRSYEHLKSLQQTYGSKLRIIGISGDAEESDFQRSISEYKLDWPNILDRNDFFGPISSLYSIHQYPSIFVLNKQGIIVSRDPKYLEDKTKWL